MARYVDDYHGIVGHDTSPDGMDPNYRGRYRGMRMGGDRHQAAYGWYRLQHPNDFGGSGGFRGRTPAGNQHRLGRGDRYDQGARGGPSVRYDADWQSGGVRNLRYDRELLRDFNANSPALQRAGSYDDEHLSRLPRGVAPWSRGRGGWLGGSNRGITEAGYGESWAWGPMRGAR